MLSGVLYALLFPKFNLAFLAPVFALPLLIYLINGARLGMRARKAFFYGFVSGTLSWLIILYWIYGVLLNNYAGYIASAAGWILLASYMGLYWGLFALAAFLAVRLDLRFKALLVAAAWVLFEYARTYIFTGFPWLLAGYSLAGNPLLIQTSSLWGVYGLSFIILYLNTGLSFAVTSRKFRPLIIPLILTAASVFYGYAALKGEKERPPGDMNVAVLQGNISQYEKWDAAYEEKILAAYSELYLEVLGKSSPDIVIWPETTLPAALNTSEKMKSYVRSLARKSGAYNLVGSVENARGKYYNSAFMVKPSGEIESPYRKMRLVPFGEFIPFRAMLSPFVGVVNEIGDFSSGDSYRILSAGEAKVAAGICYEDIFPRLAAGSISEGANLYVNITNDGWFLDSAGGPQHYVHLILRAAENRVWAVRAANTGVSAVISPYGELTGETEFLTADTLSGKVNLRGKRTVYTLYGDILIYLLAAAVIVILWKERKCLKNIKKKLKN
ncbi:MAG: apolipoprotein N-acyltransferase [Elusimicrobiota bacterium]|nr:apolipoprotein N-acyltransferase [Elusimicrobiota bacterium]